VPAAVASTGNGDISTYPNTAAGFAQALLALRNKYAPSVMLAFHISIWGTDTDIIVSQTDNATTIQLATRLATFYSSLGANFDLLFGEFSDRDSAYSGGLWWNVPADFSRHVVFMSTVSSQATKGIVLWQIPMGNSIMRTCDNSNYHYQDNRPQTLLGSNSDYWLHQYLNAGVLGLLFGGGQGFDTDVDDAAQDGITNPSPINGNDGVSNVTDDDGGYFAQQAKAYYAAGAIQLGTGASSGSTPSSSTAGFTGGNGSGGSSSASSLMAFYWFRNVF